MNTFLRSLVVSCCLILGPQSDAEELFAPPGLWIHDLWFAREGDTYHAYYLQVPQAIGSANDWSARHDLQQIGHATSTDLIHWQDQGPVVTPMPRLWRSAIATGSVARHDGKWFMPFSATGGKDSVVGMAVSDDLNTWKVPGDGPLVTSQAYPGEWQGRKLQWKALADPYLYPEPIDGWYYMLINARVQGDPLNSAGCIGVLRSRDMQTWESAGIFSYPQWCDRMETPCVWKHGDRWYLCFGTAHDQTEFPEKWTNSVPDSLKKKRRVNAIFTADQFTGPYEPLGEWWLDKMPDGRSGYIHKIIPGPAGNDVLLTSTDWKISPPYPVEYPAAGSIRLKKPQ